MAIKIPEEGLSILQLDYAMKFVYELFCQGAERAGLGGAASMAKGMVEDAVRTLYARGTYLVKAVDTAHQDYVDSVLDKFASDPNVRYVLTMRCPQAKAPPQPQPEIPEMPGRTPC